MSVELTVGEYRLTADFIKIRMHVAVMEVGTNKLIAITGPQGDFESEAYAKLFAAAPKLLAACYRLLDNPYGCVFCDYGRLRNPSKPHEEDCEYAVARAVIDEAKGRAS